eukprot:scaffold9912_cov96-Isochrysis_galbana.AAC.3
MTPSCRVRRSGAPKGQPLCVASGGRDWCRASNIREGQKDNTSRPARGSSMCVGWRSLPMRCTRDACAAGQQMPGLVRALSRPATRPCAGLGWLALSPTNRPPASVEDILGVQAAEEMARQLRAMRSEL